MPHSPTHPGPSEAQAPPPSPAPPSAATPARTSLEEVRALTAEHADLVRAALVVVFVLLGLQLLWEARILALTAFLGILFGLGAAPAVDALERRGMRRGVGSPLVIFGTVGLLVALLAWSSPTLVSQSQEMRTRFPEAIEKVESWLAGNQPRLLDMITGTVPAAPKAARTVAPTAAPTAAPAGEFTVGAAPDAPAAPAPGRLVGALYSQADRLKAVAFGILSSTLAVAGGCVLVLFLAVFIATDPDLYLRGLLLLFTPPMRRRLRPVLAAIATKLRRWLGAQAVAMLIIGSVTTVMMMILGVRAAVPIGVIAGILEFVPTIGPILSAVPAVAMAFVDSPQKALFVLVAVWGIQFLESNVLYPYLMQDQLDLPPALTMMTQVVMAFVFGIMGLFVATPMLAAIFVAVQQLYIEVEPGMESATGTPA